MITSTKLYVPVVTLSINGNIQFLENIKQGFKITISWNRYRSKITTQTKNNNSDDLVDLTFRNIDRFFVLSFKNGDDDPTRNSFDEYYMPLVEIKDFNVLIDKKPFFVQPVKNKQESYEKLIEMSRNNGYTTGNLLDYLQHQKYYTQLMYCTDNEDKSVIAERFIKTLNGKIHKKLTANDSKSYLSYLNKLADQYNNTYHHSIGNKTINADYSLLPKKH